ncbi:MULTISPECIES: hypothetical protein [unclassified Streptomyces]|uniref:hypothetical protein n=1 Tax=unclassified Streptomyces TaxID=2593676 RepID=UPI00382B45E1
MRRTASAPPCTAAAAARAAGARRAALAGLLALTILLGLSLESGAALAWGAQPPPSASGPCDPGSDGRGEMQRDTPETEEVTPARTERPGRARVDAPDLLCTYGPRLPPYPGRCVRDALPAAPGAARCAVLRC